MPNNQSVMSFDDFRQLSRRTRPTLDSVEFNFLNDIFSASNAAMGLAGETGEVVDILKKALFHGKVADKEALVLEMGDLLFYYAWICDLFQLDFEDIMISNLEKLEERYPNGFTRNS